MAALQRQARALGDPTRHEIYRFVLAAPTVDPTSSIDPYGGLPDLIGDL